MVISDLQLGVLSFGEIKHKLLKDLSGQSPLVNLLMGMDYHVRNRMGMEFKSWDLEGF